ncbi:MAG: hypothetical protein QW291_08005 [Thermofilaceae archaeon]
MVILSVRRVGLLFYASKLYSVLVGSLFILVVTRNLSVDDYGAWSVISNLLNYATAATFVNYWITRLRAAGELSATSTGLTISLCFATISTSLYALSLSWLSSTFNVRQSALLLSAAYIPMLYIVSTLYSSVYGLNPSGAAISEICFESGKLIAAVPLALRGEITLEKALALVLAGYVVQGVSLAYFSRREILHKPSRQVAARVITLSQINVSSVVAPLIASLDVALLSSLTSNISVAFYTVVNPYMNLISYSYFLARGLYPALITKKNPDASALLEEALKLTLLLAIPTTIGATVLAPNLLYLFRPEYSSAMQVLRLAAFSAMIGSMSGVLSDTLQGLERADIEGAPLKDLYKSWIFKIQTLMFAKVVLGVGGVACVLAFTKDSLNAAVYARASWLVADTLAFLILINWLSMKSVFTRIVKNIVRFTAAALLSSTVAWILHPLRIREAFLAVGIGAIVYFVFLYFVDAWFRELARLAFKRVFAFLEPKINHSG